MIDVASSNDLYVWFLDTNKEIYRWRHITAASKKFPGKFDQIDAGSVYIYALNASTHTIYARPVDGRGEWRLIPGEMKYVSAGVRDLFAIGADDKLYHCAIPCAGLWETVGQPAESDLIQLDVTDDALIAVTRGGVIYFHEIPL